jgi:hypothetical protein
MKSCIYSITSMLVGIDSTAISNPWPKLLKNNVSYVVAELLNEMLRLGADQKSMRAPVGYGQGWRR